jgi:hypothetical protein
MRSVPRQLAGNEEEEYARWLDSSPCDLRCVYAFCEHHCDDGGVGDLGLRDGNDIDGLGGVVCQARNK